MRRRFRFSRFINQHGQRQHWLPGVLRAEDECYDELAVIADHFASLAHATITEMRQAPGPTRQR